MKVLILADQCNPEWPSLPVVGYKASLAISELVEVTLVTHIRNKKNIEKHGFGGAEVIFIDTEYIAKPIHKLSKIIRGNEGGWTIAMALAYPSYLAFEWEVWKKLKNRIEAAEFDVIHRVTPMSPTLPSLLASKTKTPFVLGPLNGGLKWPAEFTQERKKEREWLSPFRKAYKLLPYKKATISNANAILASFEHTIADIPPNMKHKVINFPEVGIDPLLFNMESPKQTSIKKTILFASRLVPYKLPDVILDAFIRSKTLQRHNLLIVGDGPLKASMEAKVAEHQLQESVSFVGWKTQKEVGEYMRQSDIFAYPTIRELGAGALVEAMACKMACVVVDYGACGTLIDSDRGVKLTLQSKEGITAQLKTELEKLVQEPKLISQLGENAYQHVMQYYTWPQKAKKTVQVYQWVLSQSDKPSFWVQ